MPRTSKQPARTVAGRLIAHPKRGPARALVDVFGSPTAVGALALLATLPLGIGSASAAASSFTIGSASTSKQELGKAQSGAVTASGSLTVSGGSVAVTVSGNNATLSNLGTIKQTGTGRVVRDNTGVSGLLISNGSASNSTALMQSADADVIQMNVSPASVTLTNYGSMISLNASGGGAQVVDFTAITAGANVVNNYGVMKASEADAVRPGLNGVVANWGSIRAITSTGGSSDAIDAQTNSGVQITNYASGVIDGGRHGITGGAASSSVSFAMAVSNSGVIRGSNGSGINLDGFGAKQTATIVNSGTISGNGVTGDGDGIDVDGLVSLINSGTIRSLNSFSALAAGLAYSEGISVGGGTIVNSGTIEGLVATGNANAVGRGITLAGNDISSGALNGTREGIYANAVVTNLAGGVIRGQNDSAIVASGNASPYTVTIDNRAGATITGGGTSFAAIRSGSNSTTVLNAGTIDGSSSGQAIALGSGDNTLRVSGGAAVLLGNVNGGVGGTNTMTIDPGTGQQFAYGGSIANFNSVEVLSGQVVFSGASSYAGTTRIAGGTLTLAGADRLAAASALDLAGGTLAITGVGGGNAQTFASFSLSDSSTIDLGGASLTFNTLGSVVAGKTLSLLNASASSPYALRLLGDYTGNTTFIALLGATTVNGTSAHFRFDGRYTDVTAVPEPESYAMLLAGLGLLCGVARRRRKALTAAV